MKIGGFFGVKGRPTSESGRLLWGGLKVLNSGGGNFSISYALWDY